MKVYSNYLGREIELPSFDVLEGDKSIPVVSYNALRAAIYGEKECVEGGVQAHYNSVVTEPGHYAFICVISDDAGRRVEGFGESLPATLDTQIAKNYPSLMASKRAFSDAALLFLGINNAYSDAQISVPKNVRDIPQSAAEFAAREAAVKRETTKGATVSTTNQPASSEAAPPAGEKKPTTKPATKSAVKPKEPVKEDTKAAEPTTSEEAGSDLFDDIDDILNDIPFDPDAAEVDPDEIMLDDLFEGDTPAVDGSEEKPAEPEKPVEPAPAAPALAPTTAASEKTADNEFDFDKELISIGAFKQEPVPVVEAYKRKPDSVDWIANKMRSSNPDRVHQQKVCAAYLKHIGK